MTKAVPALEDLDAAKAELARWNARWENYSGNNPDKFQTDIRNARDEVERLTEALKAVGVLTYSEQELRDQQLDELAPGSRKDDIVTYEGVTYRRRFTPARKSRSGAVMSWHGFWERVVD